jgi:catechol 2,3-dioxygenase-like lactoylglutathione lyase family enzyme
MGGLSVAGRKLSIRPAMQLEGIDHVALGVRDVERSANWYIEVLGFERLHEGMWNGVPTFIGKGNTGIALFPASPEAKATPSRRRDIRMLHLAFRANRRKFSRRAARTGKARNQIRIPRSRNRALDLFPRSRRPPTGNHEL